MLRADEMDWNYTDVQNQQRSMLSDLILRLLITKCDFNGMHLREMKETINKTYEISINSVNTLQKLVSFRKKNPFMETPK